MQLKRLAVCIAASFLVSTFSLATGAQAAKRFSLTGGGGQTHIGNGLMIPIQQAAVNSVTTGTMFPNLLIPVAGAPIVSGTVTKPIMTAGTKMAYQRQLKVPIGAFKKDPLKTTVGVKFSNPTVFAVATNLSAKWPAAPAVFSTGVAVGGASSAGGTGTTTITGFGGSLTYSNLLNTRFGGAARFAIGNGDPSTGDLYPAAPVTVYIKINAITPPCTFPIPVGTVGCIAGIILAKPTGTGAIGGRKATTVTSPGGKVPATTGNPGMSPTFPVTGKNVVGVKLGLTPKGTLLAPAVRIAWAPLPTNMAMSQGGPWTTGQVVVANPAAVPATETWTLSGKDGRTAGGNGTIQMVAGSVSSRPASGPNANRGWVTLVLGDLDTSEVPSMSLTGLATTVALMLLAFGYTMRRRIFA